MIVMTSRPTSVVVSHKLSPSETKSQSISCRSCRIFCRSRLDRARRSNGHYVTVLKGLHQLRELGPSVGRLARSLFAEDPLTAGGLQCFDLGCVVLGVRTDSGVTEFHQLPHF